MGFNLGFKGLTTQSEFAVANEENKEVNCGQRQGRK